MSHEFFFDAKAYAHTFARAQVLVVVGGVARFFSQTRRLRMSRLASASEGVAWQPDAGWWEG